MRLYNKDYDPKKGPNHKDNRDHFVVVDKGSGAAAAYEGQGFKANDEFDAKADAGDTTDEDALADAVESAEQKLQREHAQKVAAEAKATLSGISPNPNDQSRQEPNTESADGKTVKEAVGEQPAGADSKAAVVEAKTEEGKAAEAEAKADAKTAAPAKK